MATRPSDHGQRAEVIDDTNPTAIADELDKRITDHVADASSSVLTLALSTVKGTPKGLKTLSQVAVELGSKKTRWAVSYVELPGTPAGDLVAVRIARLIPFQQTTCPSEMLVLGPFKEFPATRRAPVTVVEVFVGTPLDLDPKTQQPTDKANLAHAPLAAVTDHQFGTMWTNSEKGRRRSLGCAANLGCDFEAVPPTCHDQRAKAKYAFAVPRAMASSLGLVT